MSEAKNGSGTPKAVVHKRILEVADSQPNASLTEIAEEVSGATPDLVDRVLSEYGDPGDGHGTETESTDLDTTVQDVEQNAQVDGHIPEGENDEVTRTPDRGDATSVEGGAQSRSSEEPSSLSEIDLSQAQIDTVRAVRENPSASQGDIADMLDVSRATVSRRLNDIPGFEWTERKTFVSNLFDSTDLSPETTAGDLSSDGATTGPSDPVAEPIDVTESLDRIEARLDAVAGQLSDGTGEPDSLLGPELTHKVVHAAMESEHISDEEELELLRALL